jgi:hypothetical protein
MSPLAFPELPSYEAMILPSNATPVLVLFRKILSSCNCTRDTEAQKNQFHLEHNAESIIDELIAYVRERGKRP